ncbi:recombinase family protein [Streptomyces sp. NPDC002730]|uniref:recombinase family protein n=1 Tax=Streptomyces sp. NPDC002730 TaxID=3364662 RepID=UPI0036AC4D36
MSSCSRTSRRADVDLIVRGQDIDTSTAVGRMFFQVPGVNAEFEHTLMPQRTMDGPQAVRAQGAPAAKQPSPLPRQVQLAR